MKERVTEGRTVLVVVDDDDDDEEGRKERKRQQERDSRRRKRADSAKEKETTERNKGNRVSPSSLSPPGSGGPVLAPTLVVLKKSRTGPVHRSSANISLIVNRFFPLPVFFRISAHIVFCCILHLSQFLNRCSLVCVL